MTRTTTQVLLMVAGFVALLVVASVALIRLDTRGLRGIVIGAGLGLVNLLVGYLVTRQSLRHGMKSAMGTLAGGFIARLFVVVVLIVLFQRTGAADPTAFALTFLVFFFVYLGVEVLLVERSRDEERRAA
jgi:threonine/homoserine/homoserine lactone efflux protein